MTASPKFWWTELTKHQRLILVIAWLGWVFDVADTALFNFAKGGMMKDMMGEAAYKLSGPAAEGRIQTVFLLGWSLGGLIFGILADRIGRTKVLVWTISLYCLFTGLTALCQTTDQVMVIRFLTGIGIGGEWAAGAALIAESIPNRSRAAAAGFLQTAAALGPVLAATCNWIFKDSSWRILFVVGIVPCLLAIYARVRLSGDEASIDRAPDQKSELQTLLADPTLRRYSLIAILLGLVGIAGAGSITFWLPNLVKDLSPTLADADVRARTTFATYVLHTGTLAGVIVFPWLCNKFGRKPAFGGFFALAPVTLWLVAQVKTYDALLWVSPALSFVAIGLTAGYALYFPELFPQRVRATGSGLGYNMSRILSAPMPLITGLIIQNVHGIAAGLLISGSLYGLGLLTLVFAPETKDMVITAS